MRTLFQIDSGKEVKDEHSLLLEVGSDYCCYAIWDTSANTIDRLQYATYNEIDEDITSFIEQLPHKRFAAVFVCSSFPQALLTPTRYFNDGHDALNAVYSQQGQVYKHDRIAEWQMVNVYSLPSSVVSLLEENFSNTTYTHAYTPWLKLYNGFVADNQLSVHFTPQYFRVLLKKDAAVHLAQTYSYTTPLDVIYYLLKICSEFELEQSSVFIILSGLIEKSSNLYKELQQYFVNLHFAHPAEIKLPQTDYPHHYFTSLFNLASCVSSVEA